MWHPDAEPLARLRNNIDRKPSKIKRVLTHPSIRKDFFGGIPDNEKKAVKAFIQNNQEGMLKTKPKVSPFVHLRCLVVPFHRFTLGRLSNAPSSPADLKC